MLNLEYFDDAGTATEAGVFIPLAALPGITAEELDASAPAKESKAILSILTKVYTYIAALSSPVLGFAVSKTTPSGAALDVVNQSFNATVNYLVNHAANTVGPVPVPGSGSNAGLGGLPITSVFPSAAKIAASGSVSGAGILIPTSELTPYGSPDQAAINAGADSRSWFSALMLYLTDQASARTASVASAIVSRSIGSATGTSFPASWIQATNPVSGVLLADVPKRSLITRTFSVTIQLLLDQATQEFDVRSVTA
ncbi:hypothetical protein RIF25_09430 [Thermosynechococcaceae cyanobacterium BACA0444]|uniref:Uncharacterized protein n=1 Tax=Pseudocalidococcus azoricus BACA0444 TaxID=2918990 RepID=A0AAE4JYI5_9CYAN|nr:hypothetical protein [Pseudocalidococcus azoricus]MDS3861029.1 hypothetical protein [Pseudocalidococcus azoricus BACA0444]